MPANFGDPAVTNLPDWKIAQPAADQTRGPWWEIYGDTELNRLERLAATNNQEIALALAHFDQARADLRVARADFFPQFNGNGSAVRQRTSVNTSPTSAAAGESRTFNQFAVTADASWELDLWGRVRRQSEGARARLNATADDLESARLSVQAEVAANYFNLRSLEGQLTLLQETVTNYSRALELTQNRRQGGVANALDVAQAETQLKSAQAQIPAVVLQLAQVRHGLAVLCGQAATGFSMKPATTDDARVPTTPLLVPSEWLEHRPDVASAERSMAAANADVGVAKAAFFPKVLLNASGGYESIDAGTLFDWPSHLWALGPSVQVPIFAGGRNKAQLAAARAAYDGMVAIYRQTVLTAFQDVEDQLAAQSLLAGRLEREQAAFDAAERALDLSNNRYKAGVEQYLDVIVAQTVALTHQQTVVQLRGQRLVASVSLIKAMGAGWTAETETAKATQRENRTSDSH